MVSKPSDNHDINDSELDMQRSEPMANALVERMLKLISALQTGARPMHTPSRAVDRKTQEFIPL